MEGHSHLLETVVIIASTQDALQQRNAIDSLRLQDSSVAPDTFQSLLRLTVWTLHYLKTPPEEDSLGYRQRDIPRILLVLAQSAWTNSSHNKSATEALLEFALALLPGGKFWKEVLFRVDNNDETLQLFITQLHSLVLRAHRHLFPHLMDLILKILDDSVHNCQVTETQAEKLNGRVSSRSQYLDFASRMVRIQLQRRLPADFKNTERLIVSTNLLSICWKGFVESLRGATNIYDALIWIDLYYDLLLNKSVYLYCQSPECGDQGPSLLSQDIISGDNTLMNPDLKIASHCWFHIYRLIPLRPAYFMKQTRRLTDIESWIIQPLLNRSPSPFNAERLMCLTELFKGPHYGWRSSTGPTTLQIPWDKYESFVVDLLQEIDRAASEHLLPSDKVLFPDVDAVSYDDETCLSLDGDDIKANLFEAAILRDSFRSRLIWAIFNGKVSELEIHTNDNILVDTCLKTLIRDIHQIPINQIAHYASRCYKSPETLMLLSELCDITANKLLQENLAIIATNLALGWKPFEVLSERDCQYLPFVLKRLTSPQHLESLAEILTFNIVRIQMDDNTHRLGILVEALYSLIMTTTGICLPGILQLFEWFICRYKSLGQVLDRNQELQITIVAVLKSCDRAALDGGLCLLKNWQQEALIELASYCFANALEDAHKSTNRETAVPNQWLCTACAICLIILSAMNDGLRCDWEEGFLGQCCTWLQGVAKLNKLPTAILYLVAELAIRVPKLTENKELIQAVFRHCNKESLTDWTLLHYCGRDVTWSLYSTTQTSPEVKAYVEILLSEGTFANNNSIEKEFVDDVLGRATSRTQCRRILLAAKQEEARTVPTEVSSNNKYEMGVMLGELTGLVIPMETYFFCGALYGCEVVRREGSVLFER